MQIRNKPDFWSGVMFALVGFGAAIGAQQYDMGTAARMGPGYFPFWLGIALALLGIAIALKALSPRTAQDHELSFDWRIVGIVVGSVALAGVLLPYLGLFISIFVLVVLSSTASHLFSWKVAVINGIFLVLFVWLGFIKGLGLVFPLWPIGLSS